MILELIETIDEGFDYVESNGGDKVRDMIDDCNHALIHILNCSEGESTIRELIEEITNKISCTYDLLYDNNMLKNSIGLMKKMTNELKNIIMNEIDTQIEVAFMPYKASMWDSLESIWMEAKDDPNCDCYVVPIPYYEKDAQKNCTNVCYEGNKFPKNIEITSYETYDFENRQPEVIYIHNPYDFCNKITTVDNSFFSINLSKYTNMLVYVPYYVDGSYKNVEEHTNFGVLPGTLSATKIIAQSNIHKELFVKNGHDQNKVLNLGSPKFDATLLACKKNAEIPFEWENVIRDKKVFLFSSTIDDILTDSNWITSVNKIIDHITENDSCVAIWRPHPLTEITIKTMRPDFEEEYRKLQDKISSCNNVIIDTNSDANISIKISHTLICGYSSIMFQYMATEKPILSFLSKEKLDKSRFYCTDYLGAYFTNEGVNISDFIEIVLKNKDTKKEERMRRLRSSVTNLDGTCGQKIHQRIKNDIIDLLLCRA